MWLGCGGVFCSQEWDGRVKEMTELLSITGDDKRVADAQLASSTATLREGLTTASNAISSISLSFPMSQWIVDLQELLGARLRELSDASVTTDFRMNLTSMNELLCDKKDVPAASLSQGCATLEKHAGSLADKHTQAAMCMFLNEVCRFEADRTVAAFLPVLRFGIELYKTLCDEEKKKLGALACEHLDVQCAMHTVKDKLASIPDDMKILDAKWQDSIGGLFRAHTKLESLASETEPKIGELEEDQDAHMHGVGGLRWCWGCAC